ncbi:MAG: ECF transporter S component [Acholeplasmataceae bacterium]
MSNYLRLKKLLYIVAFAAISIVLSLIEIPWGAYLKLDFSEVAILLALLVLGPKETTVVVLLRSLVRRLYKGFDLYFILGELLAILASFSMILAYYLIRKLLHKKNKPFLYEVPVNGTNVDKKEWVVTISSITVILTVILLAANFFIATPMYWSGFTSLTVFSFVPATGMTYWTFFIECLVLYLPFNLVKGISVSVVYLLIKPRIKYLNL